MPQIHRKAFTLIEILIVVVIMAVLAAVIIPQFSASTRDASESTLRFNMNTLRSQIELYRAHHMGQFPEIRNNDLPQLYLSTNRAGETGTGPDFPLGPYMEQIPENPFDGSNQVVEASIPFGERPTAVVGDDGGWQYDPTTGAIWPNNPEFYQED